VAVRQTTPDAQNRLSGGIDGTAMAAGDCMWVVVVASPLQPDFTRRT
jgi:hypothetical protein